MTVSGFTTVVQSGAICIMAKPPSSEHIRLTISVTPEVHAVFTRMAEASGMSLGRCMGEWLADTVEGAEFLTHQLVKAREAPRTVIKQMRQQALGLSDAMGDLLEDIRTGKVNVGKEGAHAGAKAGGSPGARTAPPPLCNTGGKVPRENP